MKSQLLQSIVITGVLSISGLFCGILGSEAIVRIFGLWRYINYDERGYFSPSPFFQVPYGIKPNIITTFAGKRIATNAFGIRDEREFPFVQKEKKRVLLIGDSTTFGFGVGQDETIGYHLEHLLNSSSDEKFEVINAGVDGYSAMDEVWLLRALLPLYQPDAVLWYLGENDLDDSLSVTPKGTLTSTNPTYAASCTWLQLAWGNLGTVYDTEDLRRNMHPASVAWAEKNFENQSHLFTDILTWLEPKVRLAGILHSTFKKGNREAASSPYVFQGLPLFQGESYSFLNPLFLSPFHRNRFYSAIEEGIRSTKYYGVPLHLITHGGVVDPEKAEEFYPFLHDVFDYLPFTFTGFSEKFSLGWDPHFTSKGNKILAEVFGSILQQHISSLNLKERAWIKTPRNREKIKSLFLQEKERVIQDHIQPEINFSTYKNLHQMVGGIYPPRTIPIKGGAPLWLILKRTSEKNIIFEGENLSSKEEKVEITLFTEDGSEKHSFSLPQGRFNVQSLLLPSEKVRSLYTVKIEVPTSDLEVMRIEKLRLS